MKLIINRPGLVALVSTFATGLALVGGVVAVSGAPRSAAADPARTFYLECIETTAISCQQWTPPTSPTPTQTVSATVTSTPTTPPPATTTSAPSTPPATTTPPPSPSVTPTPTPTPTPTVTTPPPPAVWPGADNTGVPAGTVLRPTSGRTITVANSVINGEDINGCLRIEATGVLIRNSRITCRSGWAISNFSGGSMRVQDVTITCAGTGNGGIGGRVVALRNNISQCENGGGGNTDVTWEDNWVHDLACGGDFHSDAYQIGDNSNRMTFRHNRFDQSCSAGQGGTAAIIGDTGTHTDVLIENNYLTGRGSYTVYCPWNPIRYVLRNNLIGASTYGRYYPSCDGRAGQTITGNVPV